MKRAMLVGFMLFVAHFGMAQSRVANDPGYSANNYKHPNKAAYAKKHNLDRQTELTSVVVADNSDYKHPKNKLRMKRSATISSSVGANPAASHKHPFGL